MEVNVNLESASGTSKYRFGVDVVSAGTSIQGASVDAAYKIGSINGAAAWKNAFLISDLNGGVAPISSDGCVICINGGAYTITTGMDLSSYTISGNFLKGPSGFVVDGSANILTGLSANQLVRATYANSDNFQIAHYAAQNFPTSSAFGRIVDFSCGTGNAGCYFRWLTGGSSAATAQVMIMNSDGVLVVGGDDTGSGALLQVAGAGLQLVGSTQPTCDATHRGELNVVGATHTGGVKDSAVICLADAANTYAWRTLY